MQTLIPFDNPSLNISIQADVHRIGSNIRLKFQLIDPSSLVKVPAPFTASGATVPRKDNLWVTTCFEMFLRQPKIPGYQEFNFSLQPAWNAYDFADYRHPQPPTPGEDIYLEHVKWDGHEFQAELSGFKSQVTYDIGLTSVLEEKSGSLHYLALVHIGQKPDFHLGESFILKR